MFRTFKEGTGHYVEIVDTDTPSGVRNVIPLCGPPKEEPASFKYSQDGRDWTSMDLAIAVTGGNYRYASKEKAGGFFVTNILCASAEEARRRLKLPKTNPGDCRHQVRIEPTHVVIGHMPSSEDVQMYVSDSSKIISLDTGTAITEASHPGD